MDLGFIRQIVDIKRINVKFDFKIAFICFYEKTLKIICYNKALGI